MKTNSGMETIMKLARLLQAIKASDNAMSVPKDRNNEPTASNPSPNAIGIPLKMRIKSASIYKAIVVNKSILPHAKQNHLLVIGFAFCVVFIDYFFSHSGNFNDQLNGKQRKACAHHQLGIS